MCAVGYREKKGRWVGMCRRPNSEDIASKYILEKGKESR